MTSPRLLEIEEQIIALAKEAQSIVECRARTLMHDIRKLDQCCIAMGYVTFYDTTGKSFDELYGNRDQYGISLSKKELIKMRSFYRDYVDQFEKCFGNTWSPVKWTGSTGPRITEW